MPDAAVDLRFALANHDFGRLGIARIDAIEPILLHRDDAIGRGDLEEMTTIDPNDQTSRMEDQRRFFLPDARKGYVGLGAQAQKISLSEVDLDPGAHVREDAVSAQQREIDGEFLPIHLSGRLVGRCSVDLADPCRVVVRPERRTVHEA